MPVERVSVNGKELDLTKQIEPEHDTAKVYRYLYRRGPGWYTPRQLCTTRRCKIYTPEEVVKYAEENNLHVREDNLKITREFILIQKAAGGGGDKYEEQHEPTEIAILGKIYMQQAYSRADGKFAKKIKVTVEVIE